MINRDNFIETTIKKLEVLQVGQCLDIRSYKRNRKVVIEVLEDGYHLFEDGFEEREFLDLSLEKLQKLLKTIEKREFPRSNKLRFYILDSKDGSVSRANYMIEGEEIEEEEETGFRVMVNCGYDKFEIVKNLITHGDGIIEDTNFSNEVYLTVYLEEPLYKELSDILYIRIKLL